MSVRIEALKITRVVSISAQSLTEEHEYFPGCTAVLIEDGKMWTLNSRREKTYSRPLEGLRGISLCAVEYQGWAPGSEHGKVRTVDAAERWLD
jgi:hypothetical protein